MENYDFLVNDDSDFINEESCTAEINGEFMTCNKTVAKNECTGGFLILILMGIKFLII